MKEKLKYLHVLSYGKDINQKLPLLKTKICGDVVYIEIGMTYQQYLKLDVRDEKNNMIRVKEEIKMKMNEDELKIVLDKHEKWLNDEEGGERADLRDANLRYANLRYANLQHADLQGANLRDADLRDADLQDADLQDADLRDADLHGADLHGANLRYADLQDADLRDANLRDADLRYADLRDADLHGANLRYADLRGANLRYADLRDANLRHANLQDADLDFSCFPLWCGSFNIIDDGHIAKQLLSHIARLNIRDKKLKSWVEKIPVEYKNEFCERHDIEKEK
jgi:uncharacterized protein YjbI with pentapeptide repeats